MVQLYTIKSRSIVMFKIRLVSFEERFKDIKWILSLDDETGVTCFKKLNFVMSKDLKIAMKYLVFGFM